MRANWSRLSLGLMTLGVILGAAWLVMRPSATMVDASRVESGPLSVTVESDGWTRVKDLYYVNAPVGGRLLRVLKKSGDAIKAGEVVASIEPSEPTFLTSRDVNQAKATVAVAEANRDQAKADLQRAKTETEYARYTYKRTKELNKSGYYSTEKLEEAELSLKTKIAAQESSEKTLAAKEMDLAKAKAEQQQPNSVTTYKPDRKSVV